MSEQRFRLDYEEDDAIFIVEDDDIVYPIRNDTIKEYQLQNLVDKLNEQQELIEELQEENKQLKLTLSEYGVDLKAFEIFKQKIGYYDKVIDDE